MNPEDSRILREAVAMYSTLTPAQRQELSRSLINDNELNEIFADAVVTPPNGINRYDAGEANRNIFVRLLGRYDTELNTLIANVAFSDLYPITTEQGIRIYKIIHDAMKRQGIPVPPNAAELRPPHWFRDIPNPRIETRLPSIRALYDSPRYSHAISLAYGDPALPAPALVPVLPEEPAPAVPVAPARSRCGAGGCATMGGGKRKKTKRSKRSRRVKKTRRT